MSTPVWTGDEHLGKASIMQAEPDIAIERARFVGSFPYEARSKAKYTLDDVTNDSRAPLYLLVGAKHFAQAHTLSEVKEYLSSYPDNPLDKGDLQRSNPIVGARAYYIGEAIAALLRVVGAPAAMAHDLELILGPKKLRRADRRADAQAEIIKSPDAPIRQIAKAANYDAGQIIKDRDRGYLVWPK